MVAEYELWTQEMVAICLCTKWESTRTQQQALLNWFQVYNGKQF
jgi:hypothetical protein